MRLDQEFCYSCGMPIVQIQGRSIFICINSCKQKIKKFILDALSNVRTPSGAILTPLENIVACVHVSRSGPPSYSEEESRLYLGWFDQDVEILLFRREKGQLFSDLPPRHLDS